MANAIELGEFKKAVTALRAALAAPKNDISRDAAIQRFEFCVEFSWKIPKKILGITSTAPKTVIRELGQDGIIDDVEKWLAYIDLRNLTAHTYRESLAEQVYSECGQFVVDVEALIRKLEERLP